MNRRCFTIRAGLATAAIATVPRLGAVVDRPLRVAVIGHTGRGGYGHGLDVMWRRIGQTEVVGVADPDVAGREAAAQKLGGVPGFADFKVMLGEVKADVVAVGPRYIDQHHAMCLAAVASGARGIYIEKPFCRTPREADELVAACAEKNVKLAVAHRNRHHPVLRVIRELVAAGEIGSILELRSRGKEDHRGGALDAWVLGTLVFDLAAWFAGPPQACAAMLYQDGRPCTRQDISPGDEGVGPVAGNRIHGRFEMGDGTPLFFDSIRNAGDSAAAFGLQIVGTSGVIDFRIDREPLAHLRRGNPQNPLAANHPWLPISSAGIGQPEPLADLATRISSHQAGGEDLVAAIEHDRAPLCDGAAGRTTVEMVCALFASHCLGGARVKMPLETRENPLVLMER